MINTIEPKILEAKDEVGELARAFDRTIVSLKLSMWEQMDKNNPPPQKKRQRINTLVEIIPHLLIF